MGCNRFVVVEQQSPAILVKLSGPLEERLMLVALEDDLHRGYEMC